MGTRCGTVGHDACAVLVAWLAFSLCARDLASHVSYASRYRYRWRVDPADLGGDQLHTRAIRLCRSWLGGRISILLQRLFVPGGTNHLYRRPRIYSAAGN